MARLNLKDFSAKPKPLFDVNNIRMAARTVRECILVVGISNVS